MKVWSYSEKMMRAITKHPSLRDRSSESQKAVWTSLRCWKDSSIFVFSTGIPIPGYDDPTFSRWYWRCLWASIEGPLQRGEGPKRRVSQNSPARLRIPQSTPLHIAATIVSIQEYVSGDCEKPWGARSLRHFLNCHRSLGYFLSSSFK